MSSVDQSSLDYTDRGPALVGFAAVLSFVTTIIVLARFWARRLTKQLFGLDDWLCLAALLVHHVLMAASCVSVIQGGMGRDIRIAAAENPHFMVTLRQSISVTVVAYTYSSPLIKLSVLALYWRIFPTRVVELGCKILAAMCIAWSIGATIQDFVGCWQNFVGLRSCSEATGKSLGTISSVSSIINCIIDFLTLVLPIHEIIKLKISARRKFKVGGVFLLGGIVCAASVARTIALTTFYEENISNFTQQFMLAAYATLVEIYVAIIGACLPILAPVYQRLRHGKLQKGQAVPRVLAARVDKSTHMLPKNNRVAGSIDSIDYTSADDSLTLEAYPGNRHVYVRSNERVDMP